MAELKLFIVEVEEWMPFILVISGYSKDDALTKIKERFPENLDETNVSILSPLSINQSTFFAIDPDLNILEDDKEVNIWFNEVFVPLVIDSADDCGNDCEITTINGDPQEEKEEEKVDDMAEKKETQWA